MTKLLDPPHLTAKLRQQAERHLSDGSTGLSTAFVASPDALSVLYRLSSAGNTASDGLKLLHELQVHQVELDMQLEQLQSQQHDASHEFACYQQFFTMSPVACLMLSPNGIITNGNAAASRMFAYLIEEEDQPLHGRSLLSLLSTTSQPLFNAALARVLRNGTRATLLVRTAAATSKQWSAAENAHFRMTISMSPDNQAMLIMLT